MKSSYTKELANEIMLALKKEFEDKRMSGNLIDTVYMVDLDDYVEIHIPAPTYNMLEFQRTKAIIKTYHGSYASKLDVTGSEFFIYPNAIEGSRAGAYKVKPHNHIGYLANCINAGISSWTGKQDLKITLE